jgi:hypothetical protein
LTDCPDQDVKAYDEVFFPNYTNYQCLVPELGANLNENLDISMEYITMGYRYKIPKGDS